MDYPVPDIIGPKLKVLFCGINPGLASAKSGNHFARPGNRFWPVLFKSGFTPRLFKPSEGPELLKLGYGITNFVARPSANAAELSKEELVLGGIALKERVLNYNPEWLAVVGIDAFRKAFNLPKAKLGRQDMKIADTNVWVVPNPSGLNAHYPLVRLAEVFTELRQACIDDDDR